MANFLVFLPSSSLSPDTPSVFQMGLSCARQLKSQLPSSSVERDWASAAVFARINTSGVPIVVDPHTGSWLLAVGTWCHADGYASGAEGRLLQRYLAVGAQRLGCELEGFFNVVIGDARTREVCLITDVIGSCHAFMRTTAGGIALAGSSLLLAGLGKVELDPVACQEFVRVGVMYEDRTLYREVRKLGPATVFNFAHGALQTQQRYWNIGELAQRRLNANEATTALWESSQVAVRKIASGGQRIVCDLTGGYDSRALVAVLLGAGVDFSTTVSGAPDSADVRVSCELAQLTGLPHEVQAPGEALGIRHLNDALTLTDGEYDVVEYARILQTHRRLMQRFDISLNGSFGEVARGYWWELLFPHTGARAPLHAELLARKRFAATDTGAALFAPALRVNLVAHFTGVIARLNADLSTAPNTLQMDHTYLMLRMQRWQGRIASSTDQLWPCVSPFLFRSVLEVMLCAAPGVRKRSLLVRKMLAQFQPKLARHPLEHGYPATPATLANLHRFLPLVTYYGGKVQQKIAHKMGLHRATNTSPVTLSTRARLWGETAVSEILNPTTMRLAELLDGPALANFLARSRQPAFSQDEPWSRLLSLELALHRLSQCNSRERG